MIPEREREALMRLTMCAREECVICKYKHKCDFNFKYELATENMNILADALRVADTPQTEQKDVAFEFNGKLWTPKDADTPQTECPVAIVFGCDECHRPKCDYKNCRRCKWFVTDKCHECFGNELFEDSGYVTQTESTGSPIGDYRDGVGAWQTDCGWGKPNE